LFFSFTNDITQTRTQGRCQKRRRSRPEGTTVYISDPSWENHRAIFEAAGFKVETYPYYDAATHGVNFQGMLDCIKAARPGAVFVLHACCHNPTGVDLSRSQWDEILQIVKEVGLIPFMDIAYQGFAEDMESDVYAIRRATELGLSVFISNSFSKNLSLYGERVGGLSVVCPSAEEAKLVLGQLKFTVRRIYSSPPAHGGFVVDGVMNNQTLFKQWEGEVYEMRDRIRAMRQKLQEVLSAKVPGLYDVLGAIINVPIDQNSQELLRRIRAVADQWNSQAGSRRGQPISLHFVSLSLRDLPDSTLRKNVLNISTSFYLPREDINNLKEAARVLMRQSPEYARVLADLSKESAPEPKPSEGSVTPAQNACKNSTAATMADCLEENKAE